MISVNTCAVTQIERGIGGHLHHDHALFVEMKSGRLDGADLRKYVAQYRHFVARTPTYVSLLVERLEAGLARDCAIKVLEVELESPTQLEIFDRGAAVLGAEPVEPSPAMEHLLMSYDYTFEHSNFAAFTSLIVPAWQSVERSSIVGDCVRRYYGDTSDATAYWRLHSDTDQFHAQWLLEGLEVVMGPEDNITPCVRAINGAWWQFFNEQHGWSHDAAYSRHRPMAI